MLSPRSTARREYVYPLRSDEPGALRRVLALGRPRRHRSGHADVATSLDARVEDGGRTVTMRRSGYVPRADFQLETSSRRRRSARRAAWRFAGRRRSGRLRDAALRARQGLGRSVAAARTRDVVVVVDTSAGGDETARSCASRRRGDLARALAIEDHFALVALDVAPDRRLPEGGPRRGDRRRDRDARSRSSSDHAVGRRHRSRRDVRARARAPPRQGAARGRLRRRRGAATSGETGAEALVERLRGVRSRARARASSRSASARTPTTSSSRELTRAGGGQYVRIDESGADHRPGAAPHERDQDAAITDLDDRSRRRPRSAALLGDRQALARRGARPPRAHAPCRSADKVTVHGRLGGKDFDEEVRTSRSTPRPSTTSLVPRLWAAEYVRRLLGSGPRGRQPRADPRARPRVRPHHALSRAPSRSTARTPMRGRASSARTRACAACASPRSDRTRRSMRMQRCFPRERRSSPRAAIGAAPPRPRRRPRVPKAPKGPRGRGPRQSPD